MVDLLYCLTNLLFFDIPFYLYPYSNLGLSITCGVSNNFLAIAVRVAANPIPSTYLSKSLEHFVMQSL